MTSSVIAEGVVVSIFQSSQICLIKKKTTVPTVYVSTRRGTV